MSMTVQALHKKLGDLVTAGHGRKPVCVNKPSFYSPLEDDGAVIIGVESISGPKWIGNISDDGRTKWNQDGSESGRCAVVLEGGAA